MSVRAKFKVWSKTENHFTTGDNTFQIILQPVISDSEENKKFWEFTPSGRLELMTVNKAAADQLEHNKEYYIDITPA